jgi:uncharacterized protein YdaU (DUF1376 family)
MADKLPWFKFYAQDWLTDPKVLRLTNGQRGVYLWLLCRQWHDGALPYDVHDVYPLLPPGSDSAEVAYVLTAFFPPDPDTNERRNPRLAEQQERMAEVQEIREATLMKARAAKSLKTKAVSDNSPDIRGRTRYKKQIQKEIEPPMTDLTVQVVALINARMPKDLEGYRNPLTASKARSVVEGWSGEGVPESTILGAVQGVLERLPAGTRVSSVKYFDRAVREAHAAPKDGGVPDALFVGLQ